MGQRVLRMARGGAITAPTTWARGMAIRHLSHSRSERLDRAAHHTDHPYSDVDRLRFRALGEEAISQLEAAGTERSAIEALAEALADRVDDDACWRFQARSLVVCATPENLITDRLPTSVEPQVAVSDRFHLKPLLRATSFGNSGYVLALADGGVRLIEVSADLPADTVKLADLPAGGSRARRARRGGCGSTPARWTGP